MEEKEKGCLENASMEHIEALHAALADVVSDIKNKSSREKRFEDYYYREMLVLEACTFDMIRNHELRSINI